MGKTYRDNQRSNRDKKPKSLSKDKTLGNKERKKFNRINPEEEDE